jgi:sigma-54 dependent transcriptional regulator, acetoin dehydrogenase operon transcriptional activator AcoR
MLADRSGRIDGQRFGTPSLRARIEHVGWRIDEQHTGTNGVATALETRRGIAVHGGEHYIEVATARAAPPNWPTASGASKR